MYSFYEEIFTACYAMPIHMLLVITHCAAAYRRIFVFPCCATQRTPVTPQVGLGKLGHVNMAESGV